MTSSIVQRVLLSSIVPALLVAPAAAGQVLRTGDLPPTGAHGKHRAAVGAGSQIDLAQTVGVVGQQQPVAPDHRVQDRIADTDATADAIYTAFLMPREERERRMQTLRAEIKRYDVNRWVEWILNPTRSVHDTVPVWPVAHDLATADRPYARIPPEGPSDQKRFD